MIEKYFIKSNVEYLSYIRFSSKSVAWLVFNFGWEGLCAVHGTGSTFLDADIVITDWNFENVFMCLN